jgi:hypothetical protein
MDGREWSPAAGSSVAAASDSTGRGAPRSAGSASGPAPRRRPAHRAGVRRSSRCFWRPGERDQRLLARPPRAALPRGRAARVCGWCRAARRPKCKRAGRAVAAAGAYRRRRLLQPAARRLRRQTARASAANAQDGAPQHSEQQRRSQASTQRTDGRRRSLVISAVAPRLQPHVPGRAPPEPPGSGAGASGEPWCLRSGRDE